LKELLATNYSLYSGFSSLHKLNKSDNSILQRLFQRNIHVSDAKEALQLFQNRSDVALLATQRTINYYQATAYDPKTGDYLVHNIPGRNVVNFLGAFLVRRDSVFLEEFNRAVIQAFEVGMITQADRQFKKKLNLLQIKRKLKRSGFLGEKTKAIKMANLESVFNLYVLMVTVAVGVFLTEVVWFQIRKSLQTNGRLRRIDSVLDRIGNIL
jgi:hypothetical protein